MNKKLIGMLVVIAFLAILYCALDKWQHCKAFQTVNMNQIAYQIIDMSKNEKPYWIAITTQIQCEHYKQNYNLELPNIDFEKEMLILSFGSELERLKYNLRDDSYRTRKKYIAFPYFKQETAMNIVYIYVAETIPLMNTDEAGFSPDYRGERTQRNYNYI